MDVIGHDCCGLSPTPQVVLAKEEKAGIEAATLRAQAIADLWNHTHFADVDWTANFYYLIRHHGAGWQTWRYRGAHRSRRTANGAEYWIDPQTAFAKDLRAFLLHAKPAMQQVGGQRRRCHVGVPMIGMGFPISCNPQPRRPVLSLDVDYPVIRALRQAWPAGLPSPDWRDPRPNLLMTDEFWGDIAGRTADTALLRDFGALVIPGETGIQAHFYFTKAIATATLQRLVERLQAALHGEIDKTNVGSFNSNLRAWHKGLPSSLPLPVDRRHLLAYVIEPGLDHFYAGDYCVTVKDLLQELKVNGLGRLSPTPTSGGGNACAARTASLAVATPVGDIHCQTKDLLSSSEPAQGDRNHGFEAPCAACTEEHEGSVYNGVHTPWSCVMESGLQDQGQQMSREFLRRLAMILGGETEDDSITVAAPFGSPVFPGHLVDPRGLVWSFIVTKDPTVKIPSDVTWGRIPNGQTNDWLNRGLAHFHSRAAFSAAISGQGDEAEKLRRYDSMEQHGRDARPTTGTAKTIDDGFFAAVWREILAADPIRDDLNAHNLQLAKQPREAKFVVACHALVNANRSEDGRIVLPVKRAMVLAQATRANEQGFGRRIVAPIKKLLFTVECAAWIKDWPAQNYRIEVLRPNARGRRLIGLLPRPNHLVRLEFDSCEKKSDARFDGQNGSPDPDDSTEWAERRNC